MNNVMKIIAQVLSFTVLLGGSFYFGYLGMPKEMALAISAGAIGLAFSNLDKLASFKGAGFEAVMRDRIVTVVEKETEPDPSVQLPGVKAEGYALVGKDAPKVITALLNAKYTWRYASGISKESGVPREKVKETLNWLFENKLAKHSPGATGKIWALTRKGREVFSNLKS